MKDQADYSFKNLPHKHNDDTTTLEVPYKRNKEILSYMNRDCMLLKNKSKENMNNNSNHSTKLIIWGNYLFMVTWREPIAHSKALPPSKVLPKRKIVRQPRQHQMKWHINEEMLYYDSQDYSRFLHLSSNTTLLCTISIFYLGRWLQYIYLPVTELFLKAVLELNLHIRAYLINLKTEAY